MQTITEDPGGSTMPRKKLKKRIKRESKREKREKDKKVLYRAVKEQRVQIQFRLGEALVNKIDLAAEEDGIPRNDWLIQAVKDKLDGKGEAGVFSAKEVTAHRQPILFRVGADVRDKIDADVKRHNISSRTMWIVEAILASLDNYSFSG